MITEFLRGKFDPASEFNRARLDRFILLRETTEAERARNHGRLPNRLWLILFPHAGAAKPYAIVDEWDDGRESRDLTTGQELTPKTLEFWWDAGRRRGDH